MAQIVPIDSGRAIKGRSHGNAEPFIVIAGLPLLACPVRDLVHPAPHVVGVLGLVVVGVGDRLKLVHAVVGILGLLSPAVGIPRQAGP